MKRIGAAISSLARDLGMEGAVSLGRIKTGWAALFNNGPLARHTMPAELKDRRLLIHVDSPAWLHQLNFHKRQMLQKLEPFGVTEIALRIGRIYPDHAHIAASGARGPVVRRPVSEADMSFIEELSGGIHDAALAEALRGALRGWASRQ